MEQPLLKGCYARADLSRTVIQTERHFNRILTDSSLPPAKVVDTHLVSSVPTPWQPYKRDHPRSIICTSQSRITPVLQTQSSETPPSSLVNYTALSSTTFSATFADFSLLTQTAFKQLPQERSRRNAIKKKKYSP